MVGAVSVHAVVDFQVLGECDDWIVVDKPAPLIVHPANAKPEPTLLGGLEALLAYEVGLGQTIAIITRLDRETSGVVLAAKHTAAARELGGIFERREAHKEYLAIVSGWPMSETWTCSEPILRAGTVEPSRVWLRQRVHAAGRDCATTFIVEHRFTRPEGRFALVRCFPETGRMHQIRVHLAHSGHPIVGDKVYSGDGSEFLEWMDTGLTEHLLERLLLPRHALHCTRLEVDWCGVRVGWDAPLAADLCRFIEGAPRVTAP